MQGKQPQRLLRCRNCQWKLTDQPANQPAHFRHGLGAPACRPAPLQHPQPSLDPTRSSLHHSLTHSRLSAVASAVTTICLLASPSHRFRAYCLFPLVSPFPSGFCGVPITPVYHLYHKLFVLSLL